MRIKMKINKSVKAVYRKKNLPPSKQLNFSSSTIRVRVFYGTQLYNVVKKIVPKYS